MEFWLFLKGFALGFCVAVPVGPIGLMCVQRALLFGRTAGFVTGMGAAAADGMYGLIAGMGLASVTQFLQSGEKWLQIIGGVFLVLIGYKMARAPVPQLISCPTQLPKRKSKRRLFSESFLLTLTNPMTILGFLAVFAGFGLPANSGPMAVATIVAGVLVGSACWWLFLSTLAAFYREKLKPSFLARFNLVAGLLVAVFGIAAFIKSYRAGW